MNSAQAIAAQREIFLVCPDSEEIIRLSECVIEFPGRIPASPADRIVRMQEALAAKERKFAETLAVKQEKRAQEGRRAAMRQVGEVYPFIDPKRVDPRDVQVLFDPVLLVAFHGASERSTNVEVEFLARSPETEAEENRISTLASAVKKSAFKIYRVNLETGEVEISVPKEYKPRKTSS